MKYKLLILILCVFPIFAQASQIDIGTPTIATTSGSTGSRAAKIILIFSADFTGTVNGTSMDELAGGSLYFDAGSGNSLASITYTITAGSITIFKLQ